MSCRWSERKAAITRGVTAATRGDFKAAASSASLVARTLAQNERSDALRSAASAQFAQLRKSITRR
jgi:hypothetical protein